MSPPTVRVLLLLFQFGFLFLLWMLWPKLPKLCWIVVVKVLLFFHKCEKHTCLVPDFKGNAFNFSPLRIIFAVDFSYIAFIWLRYVPYIPAFWRGFFFLFFFVFVFCFLIINGCWILSEAFSASLALLYTNNEKIEREIKETIPFTIATKRIKYLGINLPKESKDLYI